ncbi:MAG TPA: pirin family protein [Bdellovibrionota bacterium]|jgi:redox-sensitive bicupin YhaK (pirin superfamily)|nr:pirin family protein [Bdellovibrionota bacterium]
MSISRELSPLELLIEAKTSDIGGLQVRRSLPNVNRRMVGPFIFFDHMGPVDFEIGNGLDVRPHPHIGLSTLTYLFEGEIVHRDTLGVEQKIQSGAVNWMTAGSGVAHSERSPQDSRSVVQRLHGIQTWIALPKEQEEVAPSFFHHGEKEIPETSQGGTAVRVVAGDFGDITSPVETSSELTYLDLRMPRGEFFQLEKPSHELALYCVNGRIAVGDQVLREGALGVFHAGETVRFRAEEASRAILVGGLPLGERKHIWWNFVSSSKERIERAKEDWREQNFGRVRGEHEHIPLPER